MKSKTAYATLAVLFALALPASALAAVTFTGTDPASPANDNSPLVTGTSDGDVVLYSDDTCTNQIGSGTEAEFESTGIAVTVPDDQSTAIYAADDDGCSTATIPYVEDSTAPAPPTVDSTDPESPANQNDPLVIGTAESGSTVEIFSTPDCTGTALGSGPAADFASTGIAVNVPDDSSTDFYATATDPAGNESPCSTTSVTYVEDSTVEPPTFSGTSPGSPANANNPTVIGAAEEDSTVALYTTFGCTGTPIASGAAADFADPGLPISVADNTTTVLYAIATDAAGNVSDCSTESITYVEDSLAPGAPSLAATNPIGPANDNEPEIVGSAEVGTTIAIFLTPDCSGTPLVSGTESDFSLSGLTVPVLDDTITVFYATAADAAGNVSECTVDPLTYYEDSTAPDTRVTFAPGGKTRDRTPTFLFAVSGDEGAARFICSLDGGPFKKCSSPKTYAKLPFRRHSFKVRAVDVAGNADPSAAGRAFKLVRRPRHR